MTTIPGTPREIELVSPGDEVYRVRIVGATTSDVTTVLLTGTDGRSTVDLQPGRHTAYVESTWSGQRFVQSFDVSASRIVQLAEQDTDRARTTPASIPQPSLARSFPEWEQAPAVTAAGADPDIELVGATADEAAAERTFSLGLSFAVSSRDWRGATLPHTVLSRERGFSVEIERPTGWEHRPTWRLTIIVDGEAVTRASLPLFADGTIIDVNPTETVEGRGASLMVRPRNSRIAALVASMNRLFPDEIATTLAYATGEPNSDAITVLAQKRQDPWAAAAAALLLTKVTPDHTTMQWTSNLAEWFPWLPDSSITAAWMQAATAPEDSVDLDANCLKHLQRAREAGRPYFRAASMLALDMISTLANGSASDEIRRLARSEERAWARRARQSQNTGPLLTWAAAKKPTKDFSPERYETLATGKMTALGLVLDQEKLDDDSGVTMTF